MMRSRIASITVLLLVLVIVGTVGAAGFNYTIVHLGDTQTLSDLYPETLNGTFSYLESIKASDNITAIIHTGDLVDDHTKDGQWLNYTAAKTLTTIKVYENPGNHDISTYDFVQWDANIGEEYRSSNVTIRNETVEDFIYIQLPYLASYDTEMLATSQYSNVSTILAANPEKFPIVANHYWFKNDGSYYPIASGFRTNVTLSTAIIMAGHTTSLTLTNGNFVEDQVDYQDSNQSRVSMFIAHNNGTGIDNIWRRDIYIDPIRIVGGIDYLVYGDLNPVIDHNATMQMIYIPNSSADGLLHSGSVRNNSWNTIHDAAAGSLAGLTGTYEYPAVYSDLETDKFYRIYRPVMVFQTAIIPDDALITEARVGLSRLTNAIGLGDTDINIVNFTIDGGINAADYNNFGNLNLSTGKPISSLSVNNYYEWELNTLGISNISKTKDSAFAAIDTWDTLDITPTWISNTNTRFGYYTFDNGWENRTPYLKVFYYVQPAAAFTSNTTRAPLPLSVQFNDASTNSPTNWSWYIWDNETRTSYEENPVITFTDDGGYNIRLYVNNTAGGDWENKTVYVTDPSTEIPKVFNWYCPAGRWCLGPFILFNPLIGVIA